MNQRIFFPGFVGLAISAAFCAGCDAHFSDLRQQGSLTSGVLDTGVSSGSRRDGGVVADGGEPDGGGLPSDGGLFGDGGVEVDAAAPVDDPFARGAFVGRAGHDGEGSATLVERTDGVIEVRFGADFAATNAPGPVVVLTLRESIGSRIDVSLGDLELGTLASPRGPQSYVVPGGDGGRRVVFVFCKPFGVEIARAVLAELP